MASSNIKGITIQFDGDTTKLGKALKDIDKQTRGIDKELKQVNNALKFNPTNVDLWRQKQQLLNEKVIETKKRLDVLKQAQKDLDTQGVDKNTTEYRELQREIITTESKLKTFNKQLREVGNVNFKAASEQVKEMGNKLTAAGEAMKGLSIAAAGVAASLGAMAVKAGKTADDLNTMAKVYGIGTQELQKYKAASDLVDVSVETIAKTHQKLGRSVYSASNGSKSMAAAFDKLGVSITNSDGTLRDSDSVWTDVIAKLGTMTDATERDAIAQQLMGRSAAELNPLIEDQGETYKQVSDTLKKYDLDFIDQATLDKANQFNDQLDTMKTLGNTSLQIVSTRLAGYLEPALEKVVDWVGKLVEWLSKLSPETLTVIGIIATLLATIAPLLIVLGKVAFGISSIINLVGVVGPVIGGVAGPIGIAIAAIAAIIAIGVLLYKNWDKIKAAAKKLGDKIKGVWDKIKTATSSAWKKVKESITKPFTSAYDKVKGIIDKIKGFFPIKLGNLFKGIKLPHFDVEWSTITAFGKSIDFPSGFDINWYKKGGIFDSPSLIGVGEAGAEAVVPLDKFWDKLDNMQGGNITINVYPSAGMNETELARKVEQALARVQKQRNMAYGNI